MAQVSRKITQVGQQLRGVHEIFSTMRENMNSVMAGMEDGLILFTREARAVMVSPAAEKFLGAPAGTFPRQAASTTSFPSDIRLHEALQSQGDELSEIAAETDLANHRGAQAASASVCKTFRKMATTWARWLLCAISIPSRVSTRNCKSANGCRRWAESPQVSPTK